MMFASGTPLLEQERLEHFVGRAREDVVGPEQVELLLPPPSLLIMYSAAGMSCWLGDGAGVEDVERLLFAFVLHGIEQQPRRRVLLVYLPRTPAARLAADADVQQPNVTATLSCAMSCLAFSAKSGQFEAGSTTTGSICVLPPTFTPPVALISSTAISTTSRSDVSEIAIVPAERMQDADLDCVLRVGGACCEQSDRGRTGGQEQLAHWLS